MRFLKVIFGLLTSFSVLQAQISVVPTVVHLTSTTTPSAGSISLNVSGGVSPYTYTWTPGSIFTKDITNKTAQAYTVKVKDNSAATATYSYSIGYKIDWGSIYGCSLKNDTLYTDNSYLWGSAVSKNTLIGGTDGWSEYILKDLNQYKCFGFLDSISPNALDYSDIDYGFYNHVGTSTLYGILNGTFYALGSSPVESTVLRVERIGNTINLKVNGVIMQTLVSSSDAQKNWKVKGVVYSGTNSSLNNLGCSFTQKGNVSFPNYNRLNIVIVHSSSPLSSNGFIKVKDLQEIPYTVSQTYTWQPGSVISSSITSKNFGTYNIMIEDNLNHKNSNIYSIGYKIDWGSIYGCGLKNDTLYTDNSYLWGSAVSKNTLIGGTDGWSEYILKDLNQYKCFGFLDSISPNAQDYLDIDYGFYNHVGTRTLYGILNGTFYALGSSPVESTVLRVERIGNTINLKVNGVIMQTLVSSSDAQKNWKVKGVVYSGTNSSLINVGCSFYYTPPAAVCSLSNVTDSGNGQINASIAGGTPPYNIAWNGSKLPTNQEYLNDLAANGFSISPTNTVTLVNQLNSLRQTTLLTNLSSGIYNNKIYDANNDVINFTTVLGTKFSWIASSVATTSCVIPTAFPSGFKVFYGLGEQVTANSTTGYAVSDKSLNALEREAYVEFAINNNTDVMDIGLKTASSVNTNQNADMADNTFIRFGNQIMQIYYNNVMVYSVACSNGDAIGILLDPITQSISYYKNSIKVFTRNQALAVISKDLQFKVLPSTNGAIIKNIIMAGATRAIRQITGTVTDVTCGSSTSGMIQFSAFSRAEQCCNYIVTGPNGYSSSGTLAPPLQSNSLYGLQAGVYTITVPLYNLGTTPPCSGTPLSTPMVQNFTIGYMPDWINQAPSGSTNVNVVDHSFNITAVQSSPYTWLAGASSQNVLNSVDAGWAEFKPTLNSGLPIGLYSNTALSFGLNNTDLSTHPSDNDYYFYVKTYLIAYSAGIGGSGSAPLVGPYLASMSAAGSPIGTPFYTSPNDVLRVNKVSLTSGTTMKLEYYKNSALQTTSGSYTSVDLVADLSVNQKNLYINKPRISFGCKIPLQYAIVKKKLDGGYYTAFNGKLYFKYDEEYDDTDAKLNFNIYNSQNAVVYSSLTAVPVLSAINGDNRYFIDVSAATPITAGFYVLEVINEKNEKWYVRFKK